MKRIEARMKKIMTQHCSRKDMCRDTHKQCILIKCKYFKCIVLPTYLLDLKRRKRGYWLRSKEYADYEKILDYLSSMVGKPFPNLAINDNKK